MIFEPSEEELEPARNAEYLLRITGLDYMRLGSHLRKTIQIEEARAEAAIAMIEEHPDRRRELEVVADHCRREAEHFTRIEQGLSSAWKPGRAPR